MLLSTPDWWHGSYNTKHGPVVYSHYSQSTSTPHYTTTWSGGGGSRDQSDAERLEPGTMPTCDKIAAGDTIRDGGHGHGIGRVDGYLVS